MGNTTVVEKLRKLIAHEESARSMGSLAEAEAFASRIAEMLTQHRLDRSEIDVKAETAEPIGQDRVTAEDIGAKRGARGVAIAWQVDLAYGVCSAIGCGLLWSTYDSAAIFCGVKDARDTAKALYIHLCKLGLGLAWTEGQKEKPLIIRRVKSIWGEGSFGHQSQAMKEWRASYISGFAIALNHKLRDTVKEQLRLAEQSQACALVHIKKDEQRIEQYIGQVKGNTKVKNQFRDGNSEAWSKGHEMGQKVALTSHALGR